MKHRLLLTYLALCLCLSAVAQRNAKFEAYIEKFAPTAMAEMRTHGVPASITLAQGLLESGAGTSLLAVKGNNHFGIKTGGDWDGPFMLKDDDAPNEQFRVYTDAAQSYSDHSLFLRGRSRYASLFTLDPTDYKGWARGLKAAGYATSPTYADRLIEIIETYELHRFDYGNTESEVTFSRSGPEVTTPPVRPATTTRRTATNRTTQTARTTPQSTRAATRTPLIQMENGAYYVIAKRGDTYRSIGKRWGVREGSLRRFNEQQRKYEPKAGERVYLVKKHARAEKKYKGYTHVVRAGETLQSIAQHYGMRTRTLYRINRLPKTFIPVVGTRLRIR